MVISSDAISLSPVESAGHDAYSRAPRFDRRITLVLGYGANDSDTLASVRSMIFERYGFAEDGGLVSLFVFPDDFMQGGRGRISRLATLVNHDETAGLIIVGAPESTHAALARLHDQDGGILSFPVFCLFPQDNVLGIEANSDLVLEYMSAEEQTETDSQAAAAQFSRDLPELLSDAVWYMTLIDAPLPLNADLYTHAIQLAGSGWTVSHYADAETGLSSLNHFIIERQTN